MKFKINLSNFIFGEMEIKDITLIMGMPKTGKTTILRLLYDIIYYANNGVLPAELLSIINAFDISSAEITLENFTATCTKEEEASCKPGGQVKRNEKALYIPVEIEEIVKFRLVPPFESYHSFMELLFKILSGTKHYPNKGFLYDLYEKYHLEVRNSLLYENLKGKKEGIRIEYSATSFTKMGILTYSVVNDLLDEYDILLMDEVNAGLHVTSQIELAILIYLLAKNHKIILTTHDLSFVDFILNFSRLIKNKDKIEKELNIHFPTFDKLPEVSLYLIQKGKLNYINPDSSAIPDYTEFYLNTI